MWLKIVAGLPRVLRRRTALPTPRAPDGRVDGSVRYPDAHLEDYRLSLIGYLLSMGQFMMVVPSMLLELCENIMDTIFNCVHEMWI